MLSQVGTWSDPESEVATTGSFARVPTPMEDLISSALPATASSANTPSLPPSSHGRQGENKNRGNSLLLFKKHLFFVHIICVCVCHVCTMAHLWLLRTTFRSFLLPLWDFRIELRSSGFPGPGPPPAETSYWPFLLDVNFAPVLLASGNFL